MTSRVWDSFLTEQDKAHLAASADRSMGFGQRPALLLVDLYRWVFGDEPQPLLEAIKDWPGSCGMAAWESIPHIQTLLQGARDNGIPVIHVTGLDHAGIEDWIVRRQPENPPQLSPEAADRRHRRYEIIDEVAPIEGEAVLRKSSPSAFWGTPLAGHLNYLGCRHHHCVRGEHQWLCPIQRGRWVHQPLSHGDCRGMRVRPPRGTPRHQPVRHEPEVRRCVASGGGAGVDGGLGR